MRTIGFLARWEGKTMEKKGLKFDKRVERPLPGEKKKKDKKLTRKEVEKRLVKS